MELEEGNENRRESKWKRKVRESSYFHCLVFDEKIKKKCEKEYNFPCLTFFFFWTCGRKGNERYSKSDENSSENSCLEVHKIRWLKITKGK